jgi:hypothetical protein
MFFFRKLFGLFFLGILIFGLLGVFGNLRHGRYQSAYQQGFFDGQQAAAKSSESAAEGSEGVTTAPSARRPGTNVYYRGHGLFLPSFGLMFCLVPLFFFGLFFAFFGKRRWHGHGRHRGHWGHGPCGPGPWRHRDGAEESTKEKSPDDIDDGPDEPIRQA